MDEVTTLGGLESEDDAKPSHGLLAVLPSLWVRGYLAHRLRIRFPEDEGVRRSKLIQEMQVWIPISLSSVWLMSI